MYGYSKIVEFIFQDVLESPEPADQLARESFVPGTGRVYVKTWGCAHNSSDSEYMAGQLAAEVSIQLSWRILKRKLYICFLFIKRDENFVFFN